MNPLSLLHPLLGLTFAPLMIGVLNRTKAFYGGRRGRPFLQPYYDLWKLLHKGAVYSRTTTWVFQAGPMIALSALLVSLTLTPFAGSEAPVNFAGDLIAFAYLLGLARFFTVAAALDTGSAFEGMGASREMQFSALAEPALLLGLAAIDRETGRFSLSSMYAELGWGTWVAYAPAVLLTGASLMMVLLAECSRVPVDDPETHLELTMIHEVMVLDHGGPDLAFIFYTASLKMWVLGALVVGLLFPVHTGLAVIDELISLALMMGLAVGVGTVESVMARLRMARVSQMLAGAGVLSLLALVLVFLRFV